MLACNNKPPATDGSQETVLPDSTTSVYVDDSLIVNTTLTKTQIDSIVKLIDKEINDKVLTKYFHPNMSVCGGAIWGYYLDSTLLVIDSRYGAELGYVTQKVYLYNSEIIKINGEGEAAEWEKYEEKYPHEKYEFDESKMTYMHSEYEIFFGENVQILGDMESDSTSINRLINCANTMNKELNREKKLDEPHRQSTHR